MKKGMPPFKIRIDLEMPQPPVPSKDAEELCTHCGGTHDQEEECEKMFMSGPTPSLEEGNVGDNEYVKKSKKKSRRKK